MRTSLSTSPPLKSKRIKKPLPLQRISSTPLTLQLPEKSPFSSVYLPETIQMTLYPYSNLILTDLKRNKDINSNLGIVVEVKKSCKFIDLKVSILNYSLRYRSFSSSSFLKVSKFEYSKLLNNLRVWAFDTKELQWIPLRCQADWDRIKLSKLMEGSESSELQKLIYDDGSFLVNSKQEKKTEEILETQINDNNNEEEKVEVQIESIEENINQPPPSRPLHLLTNKNQRKLTSDSPEKQQSMAKILEQRLLLSRL